jgi:ferredoxin
VPAAETSPGGPQPFRVTFETPGGGVLESIEVGGEEFILAAARRADLDLPSLCEQGWCLRCAVRVLAGEVDQSASRRFYEQDRSAGFALIRTGRPRSDLRLLSHQTDAMRAHRDACRLPAPRGS